MAKLKKKYIIQDLTMRKLYKKKKTKKKKERRLASWKQDMDIYNCNNDHCDIQIEAGTSKGLGCMGVGAIWVKNIVHWLQRKWKSEELAMKYDCVTMQIMYR